MNYMSVVMSLLSQPGSIKIYANVLWPSSDVCASADAQVQFVTR